MFSNVLVPTSVQFELTYRCTNKCAFCYNQFSGHSQYESSTAEVKQVLKNLATAGVFSVNFNGGEPLAREDFFEVAEFAVSLGLDIHLNTNCNLVGKTEARHLARLFPAVCTTILSAKHSVHDELSGRSGALVETHQGLLALKAQRVYLAANVTLSELNTSEITSTLHHMRSLGIETALITRIVSPSGQPDRLAISNHSLHAALHAALQFQKGDVPFRRLAFPQPYPPCTLPLEIRDVVAELNIPCTVGLNTARISPDGNVTPCTLVDQPVLGNVIETPFENLWRRFHGRNFFRSRLPYASCESCVHLQICGGGCRGSIHIL